MTLPEPGPELLRNLAELALEAGRADLAGDLLRRAAAPPPVPVPDAPALHRQALAALQAGRFSDAEALLARLIAERPGLPDAHDHLGVALANQKRYAEAAATFALAARLDPANPSPRRNRVQACFDARDFAAALDALKEARELEPAAADLALQQAVALSELRRYAEAEALLTGVLAGPPPAPVAAAAWNRLGVVRGLSGRAAEAVDCFREQVRLDPAAAGAHANLAAALGRAGRYAEAVGAARRAVELDPASPGGHANLGNALRDSGRLSEAAKVLQQAIQLDLNTPESHGNYALTLAMSGRVPESLPWYGRALAIKPDAPEVRFNRAVALLSLGDYQQGFREYEWRWGTEQMRGGRWQSPKPPWRGEPLAGKTLLVRCEQGHGDTIQFLRLVGGPAFAGARVVVSASEPLRELLATMPGVSGVVAGDEPLPPFDCHAALMSLPLLTGLRVETIPNRVPCVAPSAAAVGRWAGRVAELPGVKIGVAWQGNPKHVGDRWRSIKLERFAPLAALPGVTLVGLQKGFGRDQLEGSGFAIADLAADLGDDFDDTAGLIQSLDAVVTIDSVIAHLAGALGKPVWVALPQNADWRWLLGRGDSPWYPTMRLVRQDVFGDWDAVFARLQSELAAFVSASSKT